MLARTLHEPAGPPRRAGRGSLPGGGLVVGLAFALILPFTADPAEAQQAGQIQVLEPIHPDARVEIRTVRHSIQVERWDRNEIEIAGSHDPDREEASARGSEASFRFEIRSRGRGSWGGRDRSEPLRVRVPPGVRLELHSTSGAILSHGTTGSLSAESVSGSVEVEAMAPDARLNSVSGSIHYMGSAEELRVNSVSGRVTVEADVSRLAGQTVSGAMEVRSTTPLRSMNLTSVSGSLRFTGPLGSSASVDAESHSGEVSLALVGPVDARFRLSTFAGSIRADLPGMRDEVRQEGRYTPDQSLGFTTGSGEGLVEARSFSGRVTVRPAGR